MYACLFLYTLIVMRLIRHLLCLIQTHYIPNLYTPMAAALINMSLREHGDCLVCMHDDGGIDAEFVEELHGSICLGDGVLVSTSSSSICA